MWLFRFPLLRNTRYRRRQELRRDFLRRRLARAAGDRDDLRARSPPDVARDVLQRPRRVGDLDHTAPARPSLPRARPASPSTTAPAAPRGQRVGHERVAVEPLAANRDEQIARRQRARVDRHTARSRRAAIARRPAARRSRRRPPRRVSGRRGSTRSRHPSTPLRRRASAARATSTSSNGRRRSPMTWYFSCPLPAISTRSPRRASSHRASRSPRARSTIASARRRLRLPPCGAHAVGRHHDAALDLLDDLLGILASAGCRT